MMEPGRPTSMRRRATAWAMKKAARTLREKMASKSSIVTVAQIGGAIDAGIVDENVERLGLADGGARRRDVGHVKQHGLRPLATPANRLRRGFDLRRRARGKRHLCAGLRQRSCRRQADATARAGDESALAVEPKRGRLG